MKKLPVIIFTIFLYMLPIRLMASSFDGSLPLLCAVVDVVECSAEEKCSNGSAGSVNLSQFYKVDVSNRMISTIGERSEKAAIKEIKHLESHMIIQGIKDRGWTIVISKKTGKMTASITDDQYGFIVFGACTPFE